MLIKAISTKVIVKVLFLFTFLFCFYQTRMYFMCTLHLVFNLMVWSLDEPRPELTSVQIIPVTICVTTKSLTKYGNLANYGKENVQNDLLSMLGYGL